MANLSQIKRDRMIAKLEELKAQHNDDASIAALNEIENALREKKYGLVWEEHSEAVDDMLKENIPVLVEDPERRLCKDETLPWNFIIEGDNLQALYLLEKTHRGKVDCIYIDPPYNTGARDWKYNNDYVDGNDEYRHSKWLSMMKSRLLLAKRLLNPKDSVLICTIDEKEFLHLGCLLEEMFNDANMQMVSTCISRKGSPRQNSFWRTDEYIFFLQFGKSCVQALPLGNEWLTSQEKTATDKEGFQWQRLIRGGSNSSRKHSPGCFYPIYVNEQGTKICKIGDPLPLDKDRNNVENIEGCITVFPIKTDGSEGCWQQSTTSLRKLIDKGYLHLNGFTKKGHCVITYIPSGAQKKIEAGLIHTAGFRENDGSIIIDNNGENRVMVPYSQWRIKSHDAKYYGSDLLKAIFPNRSFPYPKSLYAVHDTIRFFVANKPNALVVDFFAGSGTTLHAVNLLNAEDGGRRRCIMVTNNEVFDSEAKEMAERGLKPGDEEWEKVGIARYVTWPRAICSINGVDINGTPLNGNYIGSDMPMSDGFQANVKYFKCDWTPRKPEDYLLSNALCLHIKEMIELQTAREVDGVKTVLILSKSDFNRVFGDPESEAAVESVWVNENLVFSADEMNRLTAKKFKYIPRVFFSQELKEAGEYV